jgi:hypothetical protein
LPSFHTPPGVQALGVFYFPLPHPTKQQNEISSAYVTNLVDDSINEYKAALFFSPHWAVSMNLFPTPPHSPPPSAYDPQQKNKTQKNVTDSIYNGRHSLSSTGARNV